MMKEGRLGGLHVVIDAIMPRREGGPKGISRSRKVRDAFYISGYLEEGRRREG